MVITRGCLCSGVRGDLFRHCHYSFIYLKSYPARFQEIITAIQNAIHDPDHFESPGLLNSIWLLAHVCSFPHGIGSCVINNPIQASEHSCGQDDSPWLSWIFNEIQLGFG